jgi:hypothetical protein
MGPQPAASHFTNPDLLATALRNSPKDWQQKNLQLVIQFNTNPPRPRDRGHL